MKTKDTEAMMALKDNLEEQGIEIQSFNEMEQIPGQSLMQTRSPYSTAVQVIKERNLEKVLSRCITEAAMAGEDFYYSWSQGGSIIEGNTVGAALMMIRNFGNSAIDVRVQELPNSYIFYGAFIDLETGFNLIRPFKMSKQSPKNKQGRDIYSGERGKDIIFQIGASKAIRNVALNALPKWLTEKVLETSKKNVVGQIENMGRQKAIEMINKKADALKIPMDRIEANYGKQKSWDTVKIVAVMGAIRSIEDGVEDVDEIFSDKVNASGEEPEIKKGKKAIELDKEKTEESPALKENNPDYWIAELKKTKTEAELDKWEEDHLRDMGQFGGPDAEKLAQARIEHRSQLREKKK